MRNLTIKRTKSIPGCLAKIKVYIEDPNQNELIINNTPCKLLGSLKNGEEKTFEIGEERAKVFVIADKLSKNFCNEFYQLEEGQEDIFLSGKTRLNPATGNAFRFDNNDTEEVVANRKRSSRKGLVVLIIAAMIGFTVGILLYSGIFSDKDPNPKAFSKEGMTIELTNQFRENNYQGFTVVYESKKVAVFTLKEEFTLLEGLENKTVKQYAEMVIETNGFTSSTVKTEDGLTYFEYDFTNPESNDTYNYYAYAYKANDAFWLIQFATLEENVDECKPQIKAWAKSVTFEVQ